MLSRVIAIVILCLGVTAAETAEVRLRSSVVCTAPIVRLDDVAEVRADDPAMRETLGLIALCPAPATGIEKILSKQQVQQLLKLSGVEPDEVMLTGSDEVALLTESATLASRRGSSRPRAVRQAMFTTDAAANTGQKAPVAAAAPSGAPSGAGARPSPPLVERGASVTVRAQRPGIEVTTAGKALGRGGRGETISVELGDDHERVLARVIGPQLVEIAEGATKP